LHYWKRNGFRNTYKLLILQIIARRQRSVADFFKNFVFK